MSEPKSKQQITRLVHVLWTKAVRGPRYDKSEWKTLELEVERGQAAEDRVRELEALLNAPELHSFASAIVREAAHQRARWGTEHDAGKEPSDWFWLLGYLAGKALHAAVAGDREKALHHTISSAAALANWHAALLGADTTMRPGIEPPTGVNEK